MRSSPFASPHPGALTRTYRRLLRTTGKLHPDALFHVEGVQDRVVALTIDDGPSSRTGEILQRLKEHDSRATFFLHTDQLSPGTAGTRIIQPMLEAGHEVANHMPNDRASILLSPHEFETEFTRAHDFLSRLGHPPRFFRAARGLFHPARMLPSLQRLDYFERFIMASYLPWDVHLPFPAAYAQQLTRGAFPGAIFVLHDGEEADRGERLTRTLETLTLLLPQLRAKGYRIEPLGQVLRESP